MPIQHGGKPQHHGLSSDLWHRGLRGIRRGARLLRFVLIIAAAGSQGDHLRAN